MERSPKTTPEPASLDWLRASPPRPGVTATEAYLAKRGIPLTRENYLRYAYPEGAPNPMPAELEMALPAAIQVWPPENPAPATPED